jgi:hypothetical protein
MNLTMKSQMPVLAISDCHGRYIPQLWCADLDQDQAVAIGANWTDVETCMYGPDHEWYWEAWEAILDDVSMTDENGTKWILYQDGDLWEVPEGFDFDREESY